MKVGILYICTGRYIVFWEEFYKSCQKYFLSDSECVKQYYVFTDVDKIYQEDVDVNIHRFYQEALPWPDIALKRYEIFLKIKDILIRDTDYVFFFNGNSLFLDYIVWPEIAPNEQQGFLLSLSWNCYDDNRKFPYDRNIYSTACIPYGKGNIYYQSGITGGRTREYVNLLQECKEQTDIDYFNKVTAVYHDESHLNKFLLDRKIKVLSTNYGRPEEWETPQYPKMIFRDKYKIFGDEINKMKGIKSRCLFIRFIEKMKRVIQLNLISK